MINFSKKSSERALKSKSAHRIKEVYTLIYDEYTCQACQKRFIRTYTIIEPLFWPVCHSICEFRVIYRFLKRSRLSDEDLKEMLKVVLKKEEIDNFNRNNALYTISKYYKNIGLASIKFFLDNGQGQKNRDKEFDKWTKGQQFPPYIIGGLSLSLSKLFPSPKKKSCPNIQNNRSLEKWF